MSTPFSLYSVERKATISALFSPMSLAGITTAVAEFCDRWPDGCQVSDPPADRPIIWSHAGTDGLWHPASMDGALRCAAVHGLRYEVPLVPGAPARAVWRVQAVPDQPRRWAATVPRRERCSWSNWPGPADGIGAVPEQVSPVPLGGSMPPQREVWTTLLSIQGHKCALCKGTPTVVDHGADDLIRGLLCRFCRRTLNSCLHPVACFGEYRSKPPAWAYRWYLAHPIRLEAS